MGGSAFTPARASVVAYGITLAVIAILATGVHRLTGIGAAIFVASDLSIAVLTFVFPDQFRPTIS